MAFWEDITWKSWLNEYVVWNNLEEIPRHKAIKSFCKELVTFIRSYGYSFQINLNTLTSHIANGLYNSRNFCNITHWAFGEQDVDYQHKVYFAHIIDTDEWSNFWKKSAKWCDIHEDVPYGVERQYSIEHYVWTQLDLNSSIHTAVVNELLGLEDDNISENDNNDILLPEICD